MAIVTICGSREEVNRIRKTAECTFKNVKTLAKFQAPGKGESEEHLTLDIYFSKQDVEYSDVEIQKAVECCTHFEQKCVDRPYRREPMCSTRLFTDYGVLVARMLHSRGE